MVGRAAQAQPIDMMTLVALLLGDADKRRMQAFVDEEPTTSGDESLSAPVQP
jgi:hypothetical protein